MSLFENYQSPWLDESLKILQDAAHPLRDRLPFCSPWHIAPVVLGKVVGGPHGALPTNP